ncbi:DUF5807 family protein [Halomarina ordinaria]|uniref:DUF5807 family protein n=1 Tax=Halomarina ordinaria TaxID=3033939 RepID=A0ABD5U8R3_9EURY|nr:DUF5807 family protein [Halomarina sp. PSRA2]
MNAARREFLAGERPDDVLMFLADEAVTNPDALLSIGEATDRGVVLVVPGENGRAAFESAVGTDPMTFAGSAMGTDGTVAPDCTDGECPSAHADEPAEDHRVRFVFAFAEERNEEVGGLYAEGEVVHAYAACSCGTTYSDRWVAGDRPIPEE